MNHKDEALKLALEWAEAHGETVFAGGGMSAVAGMNAWAAAVEEALAQPVQGPQYEFLIDDLADWKQYVEADNAPYGLREHVIKVLLAYGIKEKNK